MPCIVPCIVNNDIPDALNVRPADPIDMSNCRLSPDSPDTQGHIFSCHKLGTFFKKEKVLSKPAKRNAVTHTNDVERTIVACPQLEVDSSTATSAGACAPSVVGVAVKPNVLLVDDVLDSGLSLVAATKLVRDEGAREVLSAVFARKPWPKPREVSPDFIAWDAPGRFLIGYGMDDAGRHRGLPGIAAVD